jgi:uncharacterized membrane protein (UPF0136 family)
MDVMTELFGSGRAIDLAMAVLALEALVIWGVMRRSRALPLPTLLAGLGLLLAWRFAQGGASWFWIALPLMAAGLAHGWDLWQRWPQQQ